MICDCGITWLRGYKTLFMLKSIEHEIDHAHNVKMPTIVGILIFISMIKQHVSLKP